MTTVAAHTPISSNAGVQPAYQRIDGPWLPITRVTWALLSAVVLIVTGLSIGPRHDLLASPLAGAVDTARLGQLLPAEAAALLELGLSTEFYAWYFTIFETLVIVILVVIGLVVYWKRSDVWMAFFASITLMTLATTTSPMWPTLAVYRPNLEPLILIVDALGRVLPIGWLFVFPNGQFVPRWTRWVFVLWALFIAITLFVPALRPQSSLVIREPSQGITLMIQGLAMMTAVGSQVYRYRNVSTDLQRQQTKWMVFGFGLMAVLITILAMVAISLSAFQAISALGLAWRFAAFSAALIGVILSAVSFALSLFYSRLYDIDFVINRSLVFGGATLLLGFLFLVAFVVLRALLAATLGGDQIATAGIVASAAVVGLFAPTRQRLRRFVDRQLYGIAIDYETPRPKAASAPHASGISNRLSDFSDLTLIGQGGMGEVYRAKQVNMDRTVAIKLLPAHLASNEGAVTRFEREAKIVIGLKHPSIVAVYGYGRIDQTHYIVMEFIDGLSLDRRLKQSSHLDLSETLAIVNELAAALDYAHERGVIHRDIKPGNVMIEAREPARTVLMDFGIAKLLDATRLTTSGLVGTLDYIAPVSYTHL
ncbi:MAG: protein kinase, partial [Chloroflexi bacterium]|nr:protein kinase [Chloroflexota bacterium]